MKELSPELESALVAYLEGDCTPHEADLLKAWLAEDAAHAEFLYGMKHLYAGRSAASEAARVDVDALRHRLLERPEFAGATALAPSIQSLKPNRLRRVWLRAAGYAAAAAAMLVVGLVVGRGFDAQRSADTYNTICVDAGSKSQLVLADGTHVTMKASSSLRYPASFGSGAREVWLDGEAYFDVEHDAEHPFIVHSRRQSVRVLGTTFNVQAYSNEEVNTVTLLSGSVGLDLLDNEGRLLRTLRLHPNEQCSYDTNDGTYRLTPLDAYERQCSWEDGVYRFRDESLDHIAARLQNYYGVRIILEDESLGDIRYTGTFSLTERLDEVFSILNYDHRLHIVREGNTFRISARRR